MSTWCIALLRHRIFWGSVLSFWLLFRFFVITKNNKKNKTECIHACFCRFNNKINNYAQGLNTLPHDDIENVSHFTYHQNNCDIWQAEAWSNKCESDNSYTLEWSFLKPSHELTNNSSNNHILPKTSKHSVLWCAHIPQY